jgi:hypothetical protein
MRVSDSGNGPDDAQTTGLRATIVEALAQQIDATVTKGRLPTDYAITITIPHRVKTVPKNS